MTYQELRFEIGNLLALGDGEGMAALITPENVETVVNCLKKTVPDPGFVPYTDPGELLQDYKDLVANLAGAADVDAAVQFWLPINILLADFGAEYEAARQIAEDFYTDEGLASPDTKAITDVTTHIDTVVTDFQNEEIPDEC